MIEPLYRRVGRRIAARRKQRKLRQADLAKLLKVHRTTVANIEIGRGRMYVHTFAAIARALRTTMPRLLGQP